MRASRVLAWLLAAFLPLAASAVPFKYTFSGITSFSGGSLSGPGDTPPPPLIPVDSEFSGYFIIEDSAVASVDADVFKSYLNFITAGSVSFGPGGSAGIFSFAAQPIGPLDPESSYLSFINDLSFGGNPPTDQFNLQHALASQPGDPAYSIRTLSLDAFSFDTSMLPPGQSLLGPLPVDALVAATFGLNLSVNLTEYDAAGKQVRSRYAGGMISSLSVTREVPEPGTAGLFGAALLGAVLLRRRAVRGYSLRASPGAAVLASFPRTSSQS